MSMCVIDRWIDSIIVFGGRILEREKEREREYGYEQLRKDGGWLTRV